MAKSRYHEGSGPTQRQLRVAELIRRRLSDVLLHGDIHDPESDASQAISDAGGYQLMPEWGTAPANHYLPRRKVGITVRDEDLQRVDNPLRKEDRKRREPTTRTTLDDSTSW